MYENCSDFSGEAVVVLVDPQNGTTPVAAFQRVDAAIHAHRDVFSARETGEALLSAYIPVRVCPNESASLHLYKNYFAATINEAYAAEGMEEEREAWVALRARLDSWLAEDGEALDTEPEEADDPAVEGGQ